MADNMDSVFNSMFDELYQMLCHLFTMIRK